MVVTWSAVDGMRRGRILSGAAVLLIALVVAAAGCARYGASSDTSPPGGGSGGSAEETARNIVAIIAARDIDALAELIEPGRGLTFSPYGYVEPTGVVILRPTEFVQAWVTNKNFIWGRFDGSGEPIALPIRDYFERFVYDAEFDAAPVVAVDRVVGRGNTRPNHAEAFPNATVVEFHVPGTDPEYGGMDWSSLRCVLVPRRGGGWWLIGLVHDQWTI